MTPGPLAQLDRSVHLACQSDAYCTLVWVSTCCARLAKTGDGLAGARLHPAVVRQEHRPCAAGDEVPTDRQTWSRSSQAHPVVESAAVSLDKGLATVTVRAENQMDAFERLPQLVDLVNDLGFSAQPHFGEDNDY